MALCRSVLRIVAMEGYLPHETLKRVNKFVSNDNDACMFVTLFYGILNIETGELSFSNAGQNPPCIYRDSTDKVEAVPSGGGVALGIMENFSFEMKKVLLGQGDILLLYMDGIIEAPNPKDEKFGLRRLNNVLKKYSGLSPEEIGTKITLEVESFTKNFLHI